MVLPLYLAMVQDEIHACSTLPPHIGWMACYFSPDSDGIVGLPARLPPGSMLILDDRFPCLDHDPVQVAEAFTAAAERLGCGSALLDFERQPTKNALAIANLLSQALHCPLAAPPDYSVDLDCAVFLPPCPLHVPLAEYLRPWRGREIWLDVTRQQQAITVTRDGTRYGPITPVDKLGGALDEILLCRCMTDISEDSVRFTLFDTPETLKRKLAEAAKLSVTRAVGLYQELGNEM